jgi:predicted dehydrogenase
MWRGRVMRKSYRAAVVGLGNVGMGYDYDKCDASYILSHASAYRFHEGYELVAGVDLDLNRRRMFENKYGCTAYENLTDMLESARPEVISISVPTPLHHSVFKEVIRTSPKAVICEKPLSGDLERAREIKRLSEDARCVLCTNYMRRFEPGAQELKRLLDDGNLGSVYKVIVWYSKGLINNASHYVDLCLSLFGDVDDIKRVAKGRRVSDVDFEPDFILSFPNINVYFMALKDECFSVGDMWIVGEKGVVEYKNGGHDISIKYVEKDPVYPSYLVLSECGERVDSDMSRYQYHVVDSLYRHLSTDGVDPLPEDRTLRVLEIIRALTSD